LKKIQLGRKKRRETDDMAEIVGRGEKRGNEELEGKLGNKKDDDLMS
jgi:hypothetical protein